MAGVSVGGAALTARGIRQEFIDAYDAFSARINPALNACMDLGMPSDKGIELYGYFLSPPHPRIWRVGEEIPEAAFNSRTFSVVNYDWGLRIPWHENIEEDDQTKSLLPHVRQGGENFALLSERVFFQFLLGATDNDLLPAVPNAADGSALFAGTGSTRFGATDGNIVTGGGVATVAAIQTDLFKAISRFVLFQDTEGQPLWPYERIAEAEIVIIYGSANEEVFRRAFEQKFHIAAATTATSNAGVSNIVADAGLKYRLWSTPRITDNDWFVFLGNAPKKSIFRQVRRNLRDNLEDMTNSDNARKTKMKALQWDCRFGFGMQEAYNAIKVNN